jgi:hypothetical protein
MTPIRAIMVSPPRLQSIRIALFHFGGSNASFPGGRGKLARKHGIKGFSSTQSGTWI